MANPRNSPGFLDRRAISLIVNACLFFVVFLLFYFIWVVAFPGWVGWYRLIPCWLIAYGLTWYLVAHSKGRRRLTILVLLSAVLLFVLTSR